MKMFLGEYNPSFTKGSRIALPKKLREDINENTVILSRGFEKCIFLYEKSAWLNESAKQVNDPIFDLKTRNLKRYLYSTATEVSLDSQGRFVVPQSLIKYAGLDQEVVVLGAGDHIEIWDGHVWEGHLEKISMELAQ
jgi:MraZ protein